jgi:hypothetical protein
MECCKGCGPQETFVNCADIAIDDDGSVVSTPKPTTKTTPQQTTPKWTTPSPPTTSIQPETTTKDLGPHVTSCANDELLDCIGVGVYESLNYESWCNTYCSAGRPVCTPELCRCNCKKKVTCFAIGDYEDIPGLDDWCTDTCQYGCASFSHICSCNWVSITVWLWNKNLSGWDLCCRLYSSESGVQNIFLLPLDK